MNTEDLFVRYETLEKFIWNKGKKIILWEKKYLTLHLIEIITF